MNMNKETCMDGSCSLQKALTQQSHNVNGRFVRIQLIIIKNTGNKVAQSVKAIKIITYDLVSQVFWPEVQNPSESWLKRPASTPSNMVSGINQIIALKTEGEEKKPLNQSKEVDVNARGLPYMSGAVAGWGSGGLLKTRFTGQEHLAEWKIPSALWAREVAEEEAEASGYSSVCC